MPHAQHPLGGRTLLSRQVPFSFLPDKKTYLELVNDYKTA
jgi:hypothetical protein